MNDISSVLILPNLNRLGFSCTCGASAICGFSVTAATVYACVIYRVAVKADPVAARVGYHPCTCARVISRVSMLAASVATRAGYHSCNSRVWSIYSQVGESNHHGHGVNVLLCCVPFNK